MLYINGKILKIKLPYGSGRLRKRAPAERFYLDLKIIQAIGVPTVVNQITFRDRKLSSITQIKKEDGKADFDEIKWILKNLMKIVLPSEKTLRNHLGNLKKEGLIQSTGRRWGKKAVYNLTEKGKRLQWEYNRYIFYLQNFYRKWFKVTPLMLGYTETPKEKRVAETFMVITNPEEVAIIEKAEKYAISKHGNSLEFFNNCARMQKFGLLWYCMTLTDPRIAALKKKYPLEKLLQDEASKEGLFKELVEFSKESGLLE